MILFCINKKSSVELYGIESRAGILHIAGSLTLNIV